MSTMASNSEALPLRQPSSDGRIRRLLFRAYWRIEARITPGLRSSQYVFAERLHDLMAGRPAWLDLGCGRGPFPRWMPEHTRRVLDRAGRVAGIDLDADSLRDHTAYPGKARASASALPFPDASFDVVSCNMVVEHLPEPLPVLREVRRVLRPGGVFVFHTPSRFHWALWVAARVPERVKLASARLLEARRNDDVFSTCYQINDERRIRELARDAELTVERIDLVSTSAVTVMLGPLVLAELLWIRLLQRPRFAHLRSNIIAVLRKA